MNAERAAWLLRNPADYAEKALDPAYRLEVPQADGAVLVAVLAVDR